MIYSLFIGRWQPFHEGHKKLIQTVLDEGKNVCIAIRDTPISEKNPYTAQEREERILAAFPRKQCDLESCEHESDCEFMPQVKVIVIPDIQDLRTKVWQISRCRFIHL